MNRPSYPSLSPGVIQAGVDITQLETESQRSQSSTLITETFHFFLPRKRFTALICHQHYLEKMLALGQIAWPILHLSSIDGKSKPRSRFSGRHSSSAVGWLEENQNLPSSLIPLRRQLHFLNGKTNFSPKAASSATEYIEEPATKVKFSKSLDVPGCSSSLTLLGTGYREKVFAIIGVKVYAAGMYVNQSIFNELSSWKGKPATEIQGDLALFNSIYQSSLEKTLQIALVRDVDGKTFWDALDEAVSPRVKSSTPVDESALSTFQSIFSGRPLNKGTLIYLTWLEPSKMLVSVSSDGEAKEVDATIESMNVTRALFDVFLGESPVSPPLKDSVASRLSRALQ